MWCCMSKYIEALGSDRGRDASMDDGVDLPRHVCFRISRRRSGSAHNPGWTCLGHVSMRPSYEASAEVELPAPKVGLTRQLRMVH